ncbi:cupin domain-containing protein [Reinekea sp.]|uniref:cupin domain-containing protein n=1 Tax=Reinekea sp. TaxID=1970455 RepID=UPI00398A10F7
MDKQALQALKKEWHARGYSFGTMTDRPGQAWEDFTHPVNELVAVLSGELTVKVSGINTLLLAGEEAFIPAQAIHSVTNTGSQEVEWAFGYQKNR